MAISPEQKIYPHLVVPPPAKEEELFEWSQKISRAYEEFTRQVFNKFNGHIDQVFAHPLSWVTWRLPRPSFQYSATDKVVVPASAVKPAYFKIGSNLLDLTADVTCDIDGTGPGGLDTGTKAANTIYYLYAINNAGAVSLLASVTPPSSGPSGYTDWTYLGAFRTAASSLITSFTSSGGRLFQTALTTVEATVTSNSATEKTLVAPVTAKALYMRSAFSAVNAAADSLNVGATSGAQNTVHVAGTTTAANIGNIFWWVETLTPPKFYARVSSNSDSVDLVTFGWIEDPTEYA